MTGQLSFDDVDRLPRARRTDPVTSHEAGRNVNAASQRQRVLTVLVARWRRCQEPMTDDAIADVLSIPSTSAGKRRLELQRVGLVEPAGGVGTTRNGASALLWKPTIAGCCVAAVDVPTGDRL